MALALLTSSSPSPGLTAWAEISATALTSRPLRGEPTEPEPTEPSSGEGLQVTHERPTSAHGRLVSYGLPGCETPPPEAKCKTHPQALLLTEPEKMLCPLDVGQRDSFNGGGHFLRGEHNCLTN